MGRFSFYSDLFIFVLKKTQFRNLLFVRRHLKFEFKTLHGVFRDCDRLRVGEALTFNSVLQIF